jgi:hypothetical protein
MSEAQSYKFRAEINQLLSLIISIYLFIFLLLVLTILWYDMIF